MNEDIVVPVMGMLSVFVFFPLAVGFSRYIWRRASEAPESRQVPDEVVRRLAELQTSMDAMAVEIERISEGQRFITRVMSERPAAELPAAEPKAVAARRAR